MSAQTVRAIYRNGVFRPVERVELPEGVEVEFEPRRVELPAPTNEMQGTYEILSRRYASGHADTAERHNEHQP
jgi:predicted DNA-binding antitoxin AbrB/MazE fold protein